MKDLVTQSRIHPGIVLWEVFTFCETHPYNDLETAADVASFIATGNRLSVPPGCPVNVAELMQDCWLKDPSKRPAFKVSWGLVIARSSSCSLSGHL
jgi:hypothetical protein